jgi:hypothetical protein
MNRVSGRVVVRETGLGIPDLLVVIYDVDPGMLTAEQAGSSPVGTTAPNAGMLQRGISGDRLGSALTDQSGAFELTYEDSDFGDEDDEAGVPDDEAKRPDLLLLVLAPEDASENGSSSVLYSSPSVRQNAGRTEQYLIRLTVAQLQQASLPVPSAPRDEDDEPRPVLERTVTTDLRVESVEDREGQRVTTADLHVETTERTEPYVFLSYASADRALVLPIVRALRQAGIQVWLDKMAIAGGANYGLEIVRGIRGCVALLLAVSPTALQSRNVKQEVQLAWKHNKPYLPLILAPTTFPPDFEYWLEGCQWVELMDRAEEHWLPEVLRALSRLPAARLIQNTVPAPPRPVERKPSVPASAPSASPAEEPSSDELSPIQARLARLRRDFPPK